MEFFYELRKHMSQMKLFGSKRGGSRLAKNRAQSHSTAVAAKKRRNPLKGLAMVLACILFVEVCYFVCVYSQNSFITKWRTIYIETAMDTLSHKWLATSIIPDDIIQDVMDQRKQALSEQIGLSSGWEKEEEVTVPDVAPEEDNSIQLGVNVDVYNEKEEQETAARDSFFSLFHEVDPESFDAYLKKHPETLDNGWDQIYINEAGMDDDGTDIETIHGEQVLAIDVPNKILLVRVKGEGYIGVLAVAKDPARLSVYPSSRLGTSGQTAGTIAENNNGVLSMTGSGFIDPEGNGNGGLLAGYAMCDGTEYGNAHMGWGYKRLELHENNLMYIKDAGDPVGESTTDAVEFQPALIIDGRIVVDQNCGWTGLHPRACIGQSDKYEVLMLVIEGRMPVRSVGTHVIECAEILKRHGCMQAMNLDGGTSAILWYDGEYVTKCSNQALPEGRPLPTAFVYKTAE